MTCNATSQPYKRPHSMGRSRTLESPKYVRILLESAFRTIFEFSPTKSTFDQNPDSVLQVHGHLQAIDSNSANRSKKFMQSYIGMQNISQSYRLSTAPISPQSAKRPYSWDGQPLTQAPCTRITYKWDGQPLHKLRAPGLLYEQIVCSTSHVWALIPGTLEDLEKP